MTLRARKLREALPDLLVEEEHQEECAVMNDSYQPNRDPTAREDPGNSSQHHHADQAPDQAFQKRDRAMYVFHCGLVIFYL